MSLVVGTIALGVLTALLLVAVLMQGGGPSASGSPSPSASGTPGATQPGDTPLASSTNAPDGALAPDDLVRTTVEGLTLRADPGTAGERLGSLALGAVSFLMMGPVAGDGHDWYLVSGLGLPPATGCGPSLSTDPYECPIWLGYVAAADSDGTPWLERADAQCADPPADDLQTLTLGHPSLELLHCYGDAVLVFRAWWPGETDGQPCDATEGPLWLRCPEVTLGWGPDYPEAIMAAVDPASGVAFPDAGQSIQVTAQFDHVESAGCAEPADATADALRVILECRAQLVITAVEPAP